MKTKRPRCVCEWCGSQYLACTICGQPVKRRDGWQVCSEKCRRARQRVFTRNYKQKNRARYLEKERSAARRRYWANRDEMVARARSAREADPIKHRQRVAKYHAKHRDEINERARERSRVNRAIVRNLKQIVGPRNGAA